jgi:hypothetical protein
VKYLAITCTAKFGEVKTKMSQLALKCGICDATADDLPHTTDSQLVRMQQHAIYDHGITRKQIIGARRESPCPQIYQWRLPDGRIYLLARQTNKEKPKPKCVHYWIIDHDNVGICKYCRKKRDFGRLLRKHFKKRKEELSSGRKRLKENFVGNL